jgi:rhodanese-related sulfurtransferase
MYNYKNIFHTLLVISLLVFSIPAQAASADGSQVKRTNAKSASNEGFPGRKKYPDIPYITIDQLNSEFDEVITVDARTPLEFETIHINSAVNIPLNLKDDAFIKKVKTLRAANPGKKIVFYCNGRSCMKSYKAASRAIETAGISNIYSYDAGIFEWATAHPEKAALLNKTPVDPKMLISKSELKKHMLAPLDFINKAGDDVIILDVRDRHKREGFSIFSGFEEMVPMDNKKALSRYINQAKAENKKLFIYDEVGKQVRWVQYHLEEQGAGPYYFMKGGALAFFDIPNDKLMDN